MAIVQRLFRRKWMGNRKISSTFIREELKKGNMKKISELLGTDFFVEGTVEHGKRSWA